MSFSADERDLLNAHIRKVDAVRHKIDRSRDLTADLILKRRHEREYNEIVGEIIRDEG